MMSEFRNVATGGVTPALLDDDFVAPFANRTHEAVAQRERYYRFIVETTIAGLTAGLPYEEDDSPSRR